MLRSALLIGILAAVVGCGTDGVSGDATDSRSTGRADGARAHESAPGTNAGPVRETGHAEPDGERTNTPNPIGGQADDAYASPLAPDQPGNLPTIVFLGNSLTAGYGLTLDEAYPARIQQKLDSAGYRYRVVNAGVSGETSAGGLRRIDWLLRQPVAVLVLALGANDALRGHDLGGTRANLQAIIDRTRAAHPDASIVIAGMQAPPNLGSDYTDRFRDLFIDLARENDAALIPFLLEGVAAIPELNQPDGIHPTAEGQRILAENVWRTLEPVLRERAGAP